MANTIVRIWNWFWRPSQRFGWGVILIVGGVGGGILWTGVNLTMEYSSTLEFCVSCHEMNQLVFQEYKKTIHYSNRTGVRATCSDCHVPKEWGPKILRKIKATNEIYHKLMGSIDTPKKFETKRLELAENVWRNMEERDSQECRNCHSYDAMDFHRQTEDAAAMMEMAKEEDMSCIECHKGIAHKLPDEYED